MRHAVWLVALLGCIGDRLVPCGDLACPTDSVCTPVGCASPEQLTACSERPDGDRCATMAFAEGICESGVCLPEICGDRRVIGLEVCDDGNQRAGDGCSPDCRSLERCGNGYADVAIGEQCDDDLVGLSRDGCTSTCTTEFDTWLDISPRPPSGRADSAMAYDARRGRMVVFGGRSGANFHGDTWEYDGSVWRQRWPATSPPARGGAGMVFDARRGVVVMFGGTLGTTWLADTWEWDGVAWTERTPASSPPPNSNPIIAYDPVRENVMLVDPPPYLWTWDGNSWQQSMLPSVTGPVSGDGALAFDPTSGNMILYEPVPQLTWSWDGASWAALTPANSPAGRIGTRMTTGAGEILLYGGQVASTIFADTWRWRNGEWTEIQAPTDAGPRVRHAMAFDGGAVALFGGESPTPQNDVCAYAGSWSCFAAPLAPTVATLGMAYQPARGTAIALGGHLVSDTWEWDGTAWRRHPSGLLPARVEPAISTSRAGAIVFGGSTIPPALFDDTWEWTGAQWEERIPANRPAARAGASAAYDARRDRVVLYGGSLASSLASDTWEWDGTDWLARTPAHAPPGRWRAAMTYDAARGRIVLFGGSDGVGDLADTWEWDGTDWIELTPASSPPPRSQHRLAFDATRGRAILFGGSSPVGTFSDTWEWDGVTWSRLPAIIAPPGRAQHGIVYDPVRGGVVVFGGTAGVIEYEDTWLHQFASQAFPADHCVDVDTDGDLLIGCADPDCWGRCTPMCPPRTTCDPQAPRCGDGACSALEDHRLCAVDCPGP
jgi:cysteine-rich repeat protein